MMYTLEKLGTSIKKGEFSSFYFFCGEEEFLIKNYLEKILKTLNIDKDSFFNYKACFLEDFNFEEARIFLSMPPVLAEKKVFVLKEVLISKLTVSFVEEVEKLLEILKSSSIFILIAKGQTFNFKKTASFKKLVEKGIFVEFLYKSEEWLFNKILISIEKKGFSIKREDLLFFIRRVGRSIEDLNIEIQKIFACVEKGEIKREDILNLTAQNIEENAFNITKNLLLGNKENALKIFNELKRAGVSEILIFSAISCCFVDLYRVKSLKINGFKDYEILKCYDYKGKEFRIKNAILNCDIFSIKKLKEFIVLLFKVDFSLKNRNICKDLILEKFLFSI